MSKNNAKAQAKTLVEWQKVNGIPKPRTTKVQTEIVNTKLK